jgi:hypothetical protein
MSYAELISRMRALPLERRVELFDFADLFETYFGLLADALCPCEEWEDAGLFMHPASPCTDDDTVVYGDLRARLH